MYSVGSKLTFIQAVDSYSKLEKKLFKLEEIYLYFGLKHEIYYDEINELLKKYTYCLIDRSKRLREHNKFNCYTRILVIDYSTFMGIIDILETSKYSRKGIFGIGDRGYIIFTKALRKGLMNNNIY